MYKRICLIALTFLLFSTRIVNASVDFTTSVNVEYKVQKDGRVGVTHTISIKNEKTEKYAKSYSLNLFHLEPQNIKAYEDGSPIEVNSVKADGEYKVTLNFEKAVVGRGAVRTFVVTYEEESLVKRSGDVWEISVPKQELNLASENYKVVLSIPREFGEEAVVTPDPLERVSDETRSVYKFDGEDLAASGINAAFGKFQVFSFNLTYHLENESNNRRVEEIAIPPDMSTQRVFYEDITPRPKNVFADEDGNWLASFDISPRDKVDVKVKGYVQVFAKPLKVLSPYPDTLLENLKPGEFWQTQDPRIVAASNELKTPEAIYDFVVNTLNYNYSRVTPESERLGAVKAIERPNDAICTEFTDLFIALSRAAGIPSREVQGFAYSDNLNLQPLSLVADVLHAWPEYWDEERQAWVPIDPTWEDTSKIDYFDKFDLRHVGFAIHGVDSSKPLPAGSYKGDGENKKDIFLEFSSMPDELKVGKIHIESSVIKSFSPFQKKIVVKIKNDGPIALYDITPKITTDSEAEFNDTILQLNPYGTYEFILDVPIGFMGQRLSQSITVEAMGVSHEAGLDKRGFILTQLLVIFMVLIGILGFYLFKVKHFHAPKHSQTI